MPCKQQASISCKILPTVSPTQVFTEEIGLIILKKKTSFTKELGSLPQYCGNC